MQEKIKLEKFDISKEVEQTIKVQVLDGKTEEVKKDIKGKYAFSEKFLSHIILRMLYDVIAKGLDYKQRRVEEMDEPYISNIKLTFLTENKDYFNPKDAFSRGELKLRALWHEDYSDEFNKQLSFINNEEIQITIDFPKEGKIEGIYSVYSHFLEGSFWYHSGVYYDSIFNKEYDINDGWVIPYKNGTYLGKGDYYPNKVLDSNFKLIENIKFDSLSYHLVKKPPTYHNDYLYTTDNGLFYRAKISFDPEEYVKDEMIFLDPPYDNAEYYGRPLICNNKFYIVYGGSYNATLLELNENFKVTNKWEKNLDMTLWSDCKNNIIGGETWYLDLKTGKINTFLGSPSNLYFAKDQIFLRFQKDRLTWTPAFGYISHFLADEEIKKEDGEILRVTYNYKLKNDSLNPFLQRKKGEKI